MLPINLGLLASSATYSKISIERFITCIICKF
jgi:hypothetical protein